MSVPSKRLSKRHKRTRASHQALEHVSLTTCPKCQKPVLPHHACAFCGYYNGKMIMQTNSRELKALQKKAKTKKAAEKTAAPAGAKADQKAEAKKSTKTPA